MKKIDADPIAMLRRAVKDHGNQRNAAQSFGISQPYLSEILRGTRRCPDRVLEQLGLRRTIVQVNS